MVYLCVDKDGTENIHSVEPYRDEIVWAIPQWEEIAQVIELPKGSIEKLIGRELTWKDEPVMIE